MKDPLSPPRRRRGLPLREFVSLPALIAIVAGGLVLVALAVLPTVVWQFNPMLWRHLLRLQGGVAGLVVGAVLGFLAGRFQARRRGA